MDIANLIKHGHTNAYEYGVSFFYIALEQIEDDKREMIQHQAIATRGSKSEKLEDFLKLFDKKKAKAKENLHKSNLAMLNQKL